VAWHSDNPPGTGGKGGQAVKAYTSSSLTGSIAVIVGVGGTLGGGGTAGSGGGKFNDANPGSGGSVGSNGSVGLVWS
jgi:hypothetical protein